MFVTWANCTSNCRCQLLGVSGFLHSWMLIYTQARLPLQELSVYLKRFTHASSICFHLSSGHYVPVNLYWICIYMYRLLYKTSVNTVWLSYLSSTLFNANVIFHDLVIYHTWFYIHFHLLEYLRLPSMFAGFSHVCFFLFLECYDFASLVALALLFLFLLFECWKDVFLWVSLLMNMFSQYFSSYITFNVVTSFWPCGFLYDDYAFTIFFLISHI